ncbi:variable large family protein (plasmid) [Borrelia coriaceae]|uniref:Variable large protein n=1 Tax=Borrelia coriaceae ATCC 43381 TaxID=1408429 RepID=W5SWH5_9SPIR|nr:variable large family protein [Borrelia coriaceae]AHH11549.1 Variable outer membrane protein [Borrelia coriaceae ATCC 43381]UPA17156.1 variable large family protein [Borrelia coriaceae]
MKINIKNIRIKSICATLFIFLFLSCNNGAVEELKKEKDSILSISNLRQGFLDIFTSFSDMITNILGIKAETKKSEIGAYFNKIADTMTLVKKKLKSEIANNENYATVKTDVDEFIKTIEKIEEGANYAAKGAEGNDPIANVAPGGDDKAGVPGDVDGLVKGIKGIVDVVLGKEGNATAGDNLDPVADSGSAGTKRTNSNTNAGQLFAKDYTDNSNPGKVAKDAIKAVGAVTGADILQAIAKGETSAAAELAKNTKGVADIPAANGATDATVAGAIALRAMAKGGKFAGPQTTPKKDVSDTVKRAAISAVTKALNTLTIAIRKTIDSGLKTIKESMKINASNTSLSIEAPATAK